MSDLDEINLPASVVGRLIKESIPDEAIVSKEARKTISRAASIFVMFLTTQSTDIAGKKKHKTVTANDILEALQKWEFDEYMEPLKEDLEKFRKLIREKKEQKMKSVKEVPEADKEETGVEETLAPAET